MAQQSQVKRYIGDIEGGSAPAELKPDDNITIEHIYQTFRWYPGFAEMHELQARAIWANGLTDESIPQDRILEMKRGQVFCYLCGYVAIIVNTMTNPPSLECWHPEIEGTGFIFTRFSDFGYPTEIQIAMKFAETGEPFRYLVPNYPVETMPLKVGVNEKGDDIYKDLHIRERPEKNGYGFFIIRTPEGLNGVRGLPTFLPLVHPIRSQLDILNAYVPYAKKMGMGMPFYGLKENSPTNRAKVKSEFSSAPQTNRLIIGDAEDAFEWIQPLAASYDPFPILQWVDGLIARKTQMNKLMLEGDPAGYLSASETAISNWEKDIKEQQVFWRSQWQPIWTVLGAADDCGFQDPSKPAFISLMEGLKAAREALEGIVPPQQIVDLMNEYLEKSDKQWKLTAMTPEEAQSWMPQPMEGDKIDGNTE